MRKKFDGKMFKQSAQMSNHMEYAISNQPKS